MTEKKIVCVTWESNWRELWELYYVARCIANVSTPVVCFRIVYFCYKIYGRCFDKTGIRWMDCKLLVYDVVTVYIPGSSKLFLRAIRGFLHCSLRSETEGKCFVKFFCLQVIGKAESKCEPNVKLNIVSIWVFRSRWEFKTVLSFYREMLNKTLPFFHLLCRVVLPELVNIFPPIWLKHFKPIAEIKRADFYG